MSSTSIQAFYEEKTDISTEFSIDILAHLESNSHKFLHLPDDVTFVTYDIRSYLQILNTHAHSHPFTMHAYCFNQLGMSGIIYFLLVFVRDFQLFLFSLHFRLYFFQEHLFLFHFVSLISSLTPNSLILLRQSSFSLSTPINYQSQTTKTEVMKRKCLRNYYIIIRATMNMKVVFLSNNFTTTFFSGFIIANTFVYVSVQDENKNRIWHIRYKIGF